MVVVSEVSKYLKDRRKDKACKKITAEGYAGFTTLVCDNVVLLLLSAEESARVFVRRDDWPKIPAMEDQAYTYRFGDDPVHANSTTELTEMWHKFNDLAGLNRFDISSWIQMLQDGTMVHLLRYKGQYAYLDVNLVALVTSTPRSIKFYGTAPDKPILLTDQSGNPVAVIHPVVLDALNQFTAPDEEAGAGES